jgi:hypothetical protein
MIFAFWWLVKVLHMMKFIFIYNSYLNVTSKFCIWWNLYLYITAIWMSRLWDDFHLELSKNNFWSVWKHFYMRFMWKHKCYGCYRIVTDATNDFLLTVTAIVGLKWKHVWFYITHGPTLKMNITYLE